MVRLSEKIIASVLLFSLFESLTIAASSPSPVPDDKKRQFFGTFLKDLKAFPCGLKRFNISYLKPKEINDVFYNSNFNVDQRLTPLHARDVASAVAEAAACRLNNVPAEVFAQVYAYAISEYLDPQKFFTVETAMLLAHNLALSIGLAGCSPKSLNPYLNIEFLYQSVVNLMESLKLLNENDVFRLNDVFINELNRLPKQC